MKTKRTKLRTEVSDGDLAAICAAIVSGATYADAARSVGVRPSALRFRKQTDPAVALRLRAAWHEQARRLRVAAASAACARSEVQADGVVEAEP